MAITTDTLALRLGQRLVAHGVAIDDVEAFATDFAPDMVEWLGGEGAVPAALATKVTTTAAAWNTDIMQRLDSYAGVIDGGPNGDGLYPLTDAAGNTRMVPCIAKVLDSAAKGNAGWSPKMTSEADGATRVVWKVIDWTGGQGTKPGTGYIADDGSIVGTAAAAYDFFGAISTTLTGHKSASQRARAGAEDARDQAVAISSQIKTAQSPAAARLLIVDPQDNILAEILPDKINHPDMNTVRGQAALGAALAPLIGSSGGSARFIVVDESGNMLLDVSPTTVRHPDIDAIRVQAAAGATAGAAVKTGTALDSKLIVVDGADNLLAEINPTQIRHPDIDAIRTKANAAAVAGAAVRVSAFAESKLIVTDDSDNLLIEISPSAIKHPVIQALQAISAGFGDIVASVKTVGGGGRVAITDAADNLLGEITPSLINHPDTNSLRSRVGAVETSLANGSGADWSAIQALAEIVHILDYGQSLSVGDSPGEPILTTSLPAYAKRFSGGVRPQDGGTDPAVIYASLTSYAEQRIGTQRNGETPLGGCLQMIAQLLSAEDGIDLTTVNQILLGSAPGEGGRSAGQLSIGSTYFDRLKDNVTYGKARGGDLGKAYELGAMIWLQGESDYSISTTRDEWKALVRKLRLDVEAHAQAVTSRARPIPMLMYQTATHPHYGKATPSIALAQLDLASEQYLSMVAPCYPMPFLPSDVHLTSTG
jgi:hypothetical protein